MEIVVNFYVIMCELANTDKKFLQCATETICCLNSIK